MNDSALGRNESGRPAPEHRMRAALDLMRRIPDPALRRTYRRQLLGILAARRDLFVVHVYAIRCALHFHAQMMVRQMDQSGGAIYNTI